MVRRYTGRYLFIVLAVATGIFVHAASGLAGAAEAEADDSALTIRLGDRVYGESCDPCHANIADTGNYGGTIIFTHGYHQLVACSSCHGRFPHRPEGTEKPTMKACFDCHGLIHGPMGELARGHCEACHISPREELRPAFHTPDWAKKPHVEPGRKRLQTQCMMCHDKNGCTDCHDELNIRWDPGVPYTYDSAGGCLSCHGDPFLTKVSEGRPKSYQVVGLEESAHRGLTCQQCHVDYKYEKGPDATPLWNVNVGLACRGCHASTKMFSEERAAQMGSIVAAYDKSIHAVSLRSWIAGTVRPGGKRDDTRRPPTCADCHGGHDIQRLDTELARRTLHGSAYRMCAPCHKAEYDSYDDYYHGAAYKRGASDAPACWQCHGSHDIRPSSDPESLMSSKNMAATCGIEGCHSGSTEAFAVKAGDLIHGKTEAADKNPLRRALQRIRSWFS